MSCYTQRKEIKMFFKYLLLKENSDHLPYHKNHLISDKLPISWILIIPSQILYLLYPLSCANALSSKDVPSILSSSYLPNKNMLAMCIRRGLSQLYSALSCILLAVLQQILQTSQQLAYLSHIYRHITNISYTLW